MQNDRAYMLQSLAGTSAALEAPQPASNGQPSAGAVQGRCAGVLLMGTHLALLPAMETQTLAHLLASRKAQGAGASPSAALASQLGNAVLLDLAKLGIKKVWSPQVRA